MIAVLEARDALQLAAILPPHKELAWQRVQGVIVDVRCWRTGHSLLPPRIDRAVLYHPTSAANPRRGQRR